MSGKPAPRRPVTVRLSEVEIALLERSARDRGMSVSDVLRASFVTWREQVGDRQAALERWTDALLARYGEDAVLTVTNDWNSDQGGVTVTTANGTRVEDIFAEVVHDVGDLVQLWLGDSESDARAFVGKVPAAHGNAVVVPVKMLPRLGAIDVNEV